jgi:hypothetical protein
MSPSLKGKATATANLRLRGQDDRAVHALVGRILELAGCAACGRMAQVHFEFTDDPPTELGDLVASFDSVGLGAR